MISLAAKEREAVDRLDDLYTRIYEAAESMQYLDGEIAGELLANAHRIGQQLQSLHLKQNQANTAILRGAQARIARLLPPYSGVSIAALAARWFIYVSISGQEPLEIESRVSLADAERLAEEKIGQMRPARLSA